MGTIKYILTLAILLLFFQFSFSQPNKINPNGYNKFYYGDGRISSEGMMRDGKPDGYWKTYYVNGQIKSEGNRKDFMLDSLWVFYDENGNVTKKINYAKDKKNGYYQVFKLSKDSVEQNIMVSQELYLNDLRQGTSYYYYYDNGKVHYQINYQDNRKHGDALEFDKNGTIISELRYRNDITISKKRINRFNSSGEKNGTWKYFHPNGKLQTEAYYKNGKLNGYLKVYDEKGKLISSTRYIDGDLFVEKESIKEKAIVKKQYFENGKVKTSGAFVKDKAVGIHTTYSKSGEVAETKKYSSTGWVLYKGIIDRKGKRQGDWTYFYKSGKVKSTGKYKNNRRVGEWEFFHENGKTEQVGDYNKRGRTTGMWMWYHDNGNVLREEEFENGIENGRMIEYARNGNIVAKGSFIEGVKEGEWYYNIGDEIQEGKYKADFKDGLWKHYFPDKKLRFEGTYVDGEEQGKHKYYYANGKLKMEGEFSMGKRHNTWKFYDEEGQLRTTITYRFDEEVKIDGTKISTVKKRN